MKYIGFLIAVCIVALDRLMKVLADQSRLVGSIGFLHFTRLHNYGATLGILRGDRILLTVIGAVAVTVLAVMWRRSTSTSRVYWLGWSLLFGGAIGNLWDRVVHGYVTDMLQVPGYPAVFNVADIAIRTGLVMLLFGYWLSTRLR